MEQKTTVPSITKKRIVTKNTKQKYCNTMLDTVGAVSVEMYFIGPRICLRFCAVTRQRRWYCSNQPSDQSKRVGKEYRLVESAA